MTRYRIVGIAFLLAAAGVLIGATPQRRMAWLETAVGELIGRVAVLEAGSQDLSARLEELESTVEQLQALEAARPVVVDSEGRLLGEVLGDGPEYPKVAFAFEGLPVFLLSVMRSRFLVTPSPLPLLFTSTDCSGTPLMNETNRNNMYPHVFRSEATGAVYISPASGELGLTVRSLLPGGGPCQENNWPPDAKLGPAIPVPQMAQYVPPFRVTTRADLEP